MKITKEVLLNKLEELSRVTGYNYDLVYRQDNPKNKWYYSVMSGGNHLLTIGYVPSIILHDCMDAFIKGYKQMNILQKDANAHIILAAPDLLFALQEMMSVFQDHEQYDEESAEVISLARAAIAKAKGI